MGGGQWVLCSQRAQREAPSRVHGGSLAGVGSARGEKKPLFSFFAQFLTEYWTAKDQKSTPIFAPSQLYRLGVHMYSSVSRRYNPFSAILVVYGW